MRHSLNFVSEGLHSNMTEKLLTGMLNQNQPAQKRLPYPTLRGIFSIYIGWAIFFFAGGGGGTEQIMGPSLCSSRTSEYPPSPGSLSYPYPTLIFEYYFG